MAKTKMICVCVEPDLKQEAEEILSRLGLSSTEAITLFYRQVAVQHGLPFEVKIPNAETHEALREAYDREGLTEYTDLDQLKAKYE